MKTIHKFILEQEVMQDIELPEDAEILTVQNQNEKICLWAMLDPAAPKIHRTFAVFGTGWRITTNAKLRYIGTVQLDGGALVSHVFEWVAKKEE